MDLSQLLRVFRTAGFQRGTRIAINRMNLLVDEWSSYRTSFSRPRNIQIEPTTRCNLSCVNCMSSIWDRRGIDMNSQDFQRIVHQFPWIFSIHLQGFGEPLLCRDFFSMVSYAKSRRIHIGTVTNGTLLTPATNQRILDSGLDYLQISVDGADKATFEGIRRGASFEKVMGNTANLLELRGREKNPKIGFFFCGRNRNFPELPGVVRLAGEMGVDAIHAQEALRFEEEGEGYIGGRIFSFSPEQARAVLNDAKLQALNMAIPFFWVGAGSRMQGLRDSGTGIHISPEKCRKVFRECFITADGYVTHCVVSPDPRKENFGNVLSTDFDTIWMSPRYREFRRAYSRGGIPACCRTCTVPVA